MLLWGLSNMVVGWLIGKFGLGSLIPAQTVPTPALNYAGLAVAIASFVLYFFVKVEKNESPKTEGSGEEQLPLVPNDEKVNSFGSDQSNSQHVQPMSDAKKKILGVFLSVVAGCFYGLNLSPVTLLSMEVFFFFPVHFFRNVFLPF